MARHAHSRVENRDMSLKEHPYEYAVMTGGGLARTIQDVEV